MNTLLMIILISILVLMVIGLFIAVYFMGRKSIKNNPRKAIILVKNGNETTGFKGLMNGQPSKTGARYIYNKGQVVIVPSKYSEIYHKNKRLIFLNRLGQLISTPFDNDESLSEDERNELIYEMVESHIGADVIRVIKGKPVINIIIVAIIAFIIGAGVIFSYNMFTKNMNTTPETTQESQKIHIEYTDNITPSPVPPEGVK